MNNIAHLTASDTLGGTIVLPTSKSISNRLLLMSALCGTEQLPEGVSDSDDTRVMVEALRSDLSHIDVGAAGTSMRFLTAFLCTRPGIHEITGSERMKQRPIRLLADALISLGAEIDYLENEGFPPLRIKGGLIGGGALTLPGNVSSQYVSALMMIAPILPGGLTITLEGKIVSQPYIVMTQEIMRTFGADVCLSGNIITIREGAYRFCRQRVEGDWSASSYWYAMAALRPGTTITLEGLSSNSLQGDSAVAEIAAPLGVRTVYGDHSVQIVSNETSPYHYDYSFVNQPDLAQTFVVLCCLMDVQFRFTGLESLRIKETDRMAALQTELRKIGYMIGSNGEDTLWWDGARCTPTGEPIATYKDHRMAMSFAPAALRMEGLSIADPGVVSKSYPHFWDDLRSAGFKIS